jgi:hypothetical protein
MCAASLSRYARDDLYPATPIRYTRVGVRSESSRVVASASGTVATRVNSASTAVRAAFIFGYRTSR